MKVLFVLQRGAGPLPARARRVLRGREFTLAEISDEDSGPWFPVLEAAESPEEFVFRAGRWSEPPELTQEHSFPNGTWLALRFDRQTDSLTVRSDPFLQARWYYALRSGALYLGNSLAQLKQTLGAAAEINWRGASSLLSFGYLPDSATPLRDVYSLRSGETLSFERGGLKLKRARTMPPPRDTRPVGTSEIFQALSHAVREAIGASERIVLPLSGGMDSRVLLGLALQTLPREAITTVTFGHPTSLDYRIGSQIARSLGVPHRGIKMDVRPLAQQAAESFVTGEGMYWSVPDYPVAPLKVALPERTIALSGYIGDVVFGSYEPEHDLSDLQTARTLLRETITSVPLPFVQRLLPDCRDDVSEAFAGCETTSPLHAFESFIYNSHQMNRTNFALFVHRDRACYATPFVHANVLEVAYRLSADERRNERAFFAMIHKHLPELWAFPLKSSFGYPPHLRHARRTLIARGWRRLLQEFDARVGPMTGKILYRHPRFNYAHPREWLASPHREYVEQCLERLMTVSAFDRSELERKRADLRSGRGLDPLLLKGLVTLAQWDEFYGAGA